MTRTLILDGPKYSQIWNILGFNIKKRKNDCGIYSVFGYILEPSGNMLPKKESDSILDEIMKTWIGDGSFDDDYTHAFLK